MKPKENCFLSFLKNCFMFYMIIWVILGLMMVIIIPTACLAYFFLPFLFTYNLELSHWLIITLGCIIGGTIHYLFREVILDKEFTFNKLYNSMYNKKQVKQVRMGDGIVLEYIRGRLINRYGENPNCDYMLNLKRIIDDK